MSQEKRFKWILTTGFLLCLVTIFLATVCNSFGKPPRISKPKNNPSGLEIGWQQKYGKLNLEAIAKFLKYENIQMISFVNDKGTMYLVDSSGKEIGYETDAKGTRTSKWCKVDGTQLEEGCLNFKAHMITNVNTMSTLYGHGSPYQILIQIDGYWVCWDVIEQKVCD